MACGWFPESLHHCEELGQYSQQLDKRDEIRYVNAFVSLGSRVSPGTENRFMVKRREVASKPLPHSKTQEGRKGE